VLLSKVDSKTRSKEAAMNVLNSKDFARLTREHLEQVHHIAGERTAHLHAEGLHDRHRDAHSISEMGSHGTAPHVSPPNLHGFLPEVPDQPSTSDSEVTQVLTRVNFDRPADARMIADARKASGMPAAFYEDPARFRHDLKAHMRAAHVPPGNASIHSTPALYRYHQAEHAAPAGERYLGHSYPDYLHGFAAPLSPPASSDAPAVEAPQWADGKPANLAAVIERLESMERRQMDLAKAIMRDVRKLWAGIEDADRRIQPARPSPSTLDAHGVRQAQGLLAESLLSLGAIDNSHFNHSKWPAPGSERSMQALRAMHRALAILDGMAIADDACNCAAGVDAREGTVVNHAVGCARRDSRPVWS
jgi:hypothetical protein